MTADISNPGFTPDELRRAWLRLEAEWQPLEKNPPEIIDLRRVYLQRVERLAQFSQQDILANGWVESLHMLGLLREHLANSLAHPLELEAVARETVRGWKVIAALPESYENPTALP